MEKKQENKIDSTSSLRACQSCKKDFTIEPNDFGFYEKMKVPAPTFCPECRFQRRLVVRNNRVFYRCECELCKKAILTVYSKQKSYTVYCRECWLSDKWDPISHGRDYDFSIPFFQQFKLLQEKIPKVNLYQTNFVSSEYCNYGLDMKECYLLFGGQKNERVYFGNQVIDSKDSLDIAFSEKLEFCYEDFECTRSNKLFFSRYSSDCADSSYLIDCRNCISCFGCVRLVNKQYCIWNMQYSKEEYLLKIKILSQGSYRAHLENLQRLKELRLQIPHRYARVYKSVNSDGDDLSEARNSNYSFSSSENEDSKYLFFCRHKSKDCHDTSFQGFNAEKLYEIAHGFGGFNIAFGMRNFSNQDSRYNKECHECKNIFGCEGLRKKSFCILNKQYSKEEYEKLVPKIIKHMDQMPYIDKKGKTYKYGEFFPTELSPFAYNESIAQEYFPLTKDEALVQGHQWQDGETRNYKIDIENKDIPNDIKDVGEDIVNKVIACGHDGKCKDQCTEAFKVVPEEFKFYKRMNLPLPRLCPNCRHYNRINFRNPLKLFNRICMCDKESHFHNKDKCVIKFKTSYAPDRPEIVYCEKCYQQEIY